MKQRITAVFLLLLLCVGLTAGCAAEPQGADENPLPYVYFLSSDALNAVPSSADAVEATLNNLSAFAVTTGDRFTVCPNASEEILCSGSLDPVTVAAKEKTDLRFPLKKAVLESGGIYRLSLDVSYSVSGGDETTGTVSFFFRCYDPAPAEVTDEMLSAPLSSLTPQEADLVAQYLFQIYLPCSFGLYDSVAALKSPSIWSSVEALNAAVDNDTSEASHRLESVLEKVRIYYPDAEFDPTAVRVYDKDTKTFLRSDRIESEPFVFLSCEIHDGMISITYEDLPDADGEPPVRYRTTLKNSTKKGYFSFVSSVRDSAIG